jgi:hypothetical protein
MKRSRLVLLLFLIAHLCQAVSANAQSNGVLREVWLNISGSAVSDLTNNAAFPASPSFDGVLTNGFEAPTNVYDNYGQRLRALLLPPTTGTYYFLIASDDNSQLFLSTNDTPAGKRLIARVDGWTNPRMYHDQAAQKSAAVSLTAGQHYYIEALMKEGGGGDNLAVAWQKPGDADPADGSAPIPNTNLLAYGLGPPLFTVHPQNASVVENGSTNFSVQLSRSLGASLQWMSNGTNILGATSATYATGPLRLADSGGTLYCRATNSYGATNSNTATLIVTADTTRPTISYAQSFGDSTLVTVGFSEPVDPVSAGNPGNFFLNNGATILNAALLDDGSTVVLRTSPLAWGTTYTLTVSNVRDLAQTPNAILPNSQRAFYVSYTPLPITYVLGTNEPAGPSSRRTALAISEIMYHPANRADGRNLEFIEIYNSNPWAEDLSGHRISGDIGYSFPAGTTIPALGYLVVAANPSDVQSVYGLTNVLGPLTNSTPGNTTNVLDNGGATIRLRDELNAVLLEVTYDDQPPWPAAADGAGHSLVLARPSYGEGDWRAWSASDRVGGSPGAYDAYTPAATRSVLINEILAHTDPPQEDSIELFNYSSVPVDLSGCVLSDDPATNKFHIAAGTTIPARGFLAFTGTQLGFRLNAAGETVYFVAADGSRVLNAVRFSAQENGVAFGRFPDGAPAFRRLSSVTLGTNNAPPLFSNVVINELQYKPASSDDNEEFVELHNRGTNAIPLDKWRLSGGVSYTFPVGTSLPAGGYLVVAKDIATLLSAHPNLSAAAVLGGYSGKLANGGDVVRLDQPHDLVTTNELAQLVTNKIHIVVDEVAYGTGGRWGYWSDGDGSSLERKDPRSDGHLAPNWADSDETAKSAWTTVEFTGVLDNGAMASGDQLQLFLLGAGECLVDNVEVIPQGGANLVANGTFDAGTSGWYFQGTHGQSAWQASGGFSGGCLHIVASDRGDTGANRIRTVLTQTLAEGTTATLRAKVRWLKGHPEILLRLHGNWLEATGNTLTTRNLGSPGVRNTQFRINAGPAITDVRHWPVLPAAGQAVMVTAQIEDPDGIAQALVKYRVDPASNYVTVLMNYCGAGFFSGVIPGQASGARAAFYLEARDAFTPNATSRFPDDAPTRECLVGFGETTPAGSFGAYRLWLSQRNVTRWAAREKQSNDPLDATFVYGGSRICYNVGTLYSGSPFHTPGYDSPDGSACDYEVNFAKDDLLLGINDFVLATIGNLNSDPTYQAEQTAFWISRKLGAPYLHRRYIRLFFNGQQRSVVYEDAQQPNGDVVSEFFPDDAAGNLHKIEDWFEFDDTGDSMLGNVDSTLQNFTTTGGAKKTARYRWNWRPRAGGEAANAFTNLFALVDALNAAQPEPYRSGAAGLVSVAEFMRVLAMDRIVGNWDSYGYTRGKNMFAYKPTQSPWTLLPWDVDFVFSSGGNSATDPLFGSNEPVLDALRAFPEFQRAYWRAFQDAVNGPLQATTLAARLDPQYNALVAAGVGPASPQTLKDYAAQRRTYILSQLATVAAPFAVNPTVTVSNGLGVISGTAPVNVGTLTVNGAAWIVRWTTVSNWVVTVPLQTGSNFFSVVGLDVNGQAVSGASNSVSPVYNFAVPSPVDTVVINEIMFDPVLPDAEYVELFNTSTTNAFDLSGWIFNGLSYTFANGTSIGPRGFLVLAKSRAAFRTAYGTNVYVFDEFSGNLQSNGETLSLLKPGAPLGTSIVVDRVRYEAASPWPAAVAGTALQLRDPAQDNSRVANWAVGDMTVTPPQSVPLLAYTNVWRFMQVSNLDSVNWTAPAYNDAAWPSGPGLLAYESNPAITPLIRTSLNPPATATNNASSGHAYYFRTQVNVTNHLNGFTLNASAYLDDGAVFYVNGVEAKRIRLADGIVTNLTFTTGQPPGGDALNPDVFTLDTALFVPGTNVIAVEVHQNQANSSDITFGLKLDADFAGISNSIALVTPGATNSVLAPLAAFPSLWLNEVQADNLSGPLDNAGQHEPWVELLNSGSNALSLGGYFLSDSYTNLSQWAFPSNVTIPAAGFTLVWCDSETNQTATNGLHASFRLASGAGKVALSRLISNTVQLVDYLTYTNLPSNWSYGDIPDAQPFYRGAMFQSTPAATNNGAAPPLTVFINEWMADNKATLADPADNDFEDWFELYNPGTNAVDLGGYYLTDNLTNKFQFLVPNNGHYLIPPAGFLLVWADNEPGQNNTNRADLHASFALSKGGEAIGIFAADGTQIDAVTFGPQTTDVSQGRFPDGSAHILPMTIPSPRAPNVLPNTAPILAAISDKECILGQTLVFTASASDTDAPPQRLTFSLGPGAPSGATIDSLSGEFRWTPATAPDTCTISVVVTDSGSPSLSATQTARVTILLPPTISVQVKGNQMRLTWPRGTLQEADEVTGPYRDVTEISPLTVDLSEATRFYRIRL